MKLNIDLSSPVYVLKGDDDVLLEDTVLELVHALVGDGDRTLMVEELDASRYESDGGEYQIGPLVDAAQTPPFLTERRVVVGRHAAVFSTNDAVAPLVGYLVDPLPSTALVLVWEKGPKTGAKLNKVPTKLADAIKKSGGVVLDTGAGTGKARSQWLDEHLKDAAVKLDASARKVIEDQIGEDAGLLVGLLPTLEAVFGAGARVTADDLGPYLGQEGGAKPWDLTDAIDRGDVTGALEKLHRIMEGSGQHPLQIMGTLTNHYTRMLTLDGAGVADEQRAAEVLGIKGSTFPAKKALAQARKLGPDRLAEFTVLLAQADLDLKGAKAWPAELVVEVLVARLASRTPKSSAARSGSGGGYRR
jgi:DNA polymerase-3 subunit delta